MNFLKKIFLFGFLVVMISCGGESAENNSSSTASLETSASKKKSERSTTKTTQKKKRILFFGDSLTAGYGLEDDSESFVGVIQRKLDSLNLNYQTINGGVSGETTSGGAERIDWVLEQNEIEIFILELGGNDGLRGIQPAESTKNLQSIIDKVKGKYPDAKIVLAGMEAPPNMGNDFTLAFRNIFPKLAKENEVALIPFLLDGVGGNPELNQRDRIHPNIQGHAILAENVWDILKPLL